MAYDDAQKPDSPWGLTATAHLTWSPLALLAAFLLAASWPHTPAASGLPAPTSWIAWGVALVYLAANSACHARLAFVARHSPERHPRHLWWLPAAQLPLAAIAAWSILLGPNNPLYLAGLGRIDAVLLFGSVFSTLLSTAASILAARQPADASLRSDLPCLWLAALCAVAAVVAAASLLVILSSSPPA